MLIFFGLNVVFVFMSACLILGVVLLAMYLIEAKAQKVDDGVGRIVSLKWNTHKAMDEPVPIYTVECLINGILYCQEAKRIAKKFCLSSKSHEFDREKDVEIRYRKKDGKMKLYIHEPKETLYKTALLMGLGVLGIIGIIILWTIAYKQIY